VQQLAARLRTKELSAFFTSCGVVKEAQIVKDRISQRSKGLVHCCTCLIYLTDMFTVLATLSSRTKSLSKRRCS
jgi:hypothetical protein